MRSSSLVLALTLAHGPAATAARQPAGDVGCYRADRALGTSAASALGRAVPGETGRQIGEDSAGLGRLATFRLLAGGRVERPGTVGRGWWARGSRWERAGDTLRVRLSTMTSGWALRLVPAPGGADSGYVGVARYLTDAVVRDTGAGAWRPPQYPVRVRRESCAPDA